MEGEGEGSHAWRSMEGKGKAPHVWRPMEGEGEAPHARRPMEGEAPHARRPMEGEGEGSLLPFFIFPPTNFTIFSSFFFPFDFNLLLYHGFNCYLRLSSLSLAYKLWLRIQCHKFPTFHC